MSIRLDPRRVNALKHLAGEAGVRPGDLVRQWVEERIDAARVGAGGVSMETRVEALERRLAALESAGASAGAEAGEREAAAPEPSEPLPTIAGSADDAADRSTPAAEADADEPPAPKRVTASPSGERVALHEEMIDLIRERGPMTAGELADAITERGRYAPPRSGKPIDAAMVSQRVSNPTYRSRFTRAEGRIGLADAD